MKTCHAFTRIELASILAILAVAALIFLGSPGTRQKSARIACVSNLKQIGTAYRIWSSDNGDQSPTSALNSNAGWNTILAGTNAGAHCWVFYSVLFKDYGFNPSVLTCPADERQPAKKPDEITNNDHLSYFINTEANDTYPQSLLGGDRNLGPGTVADAEYGYSPTNGMGNDVIITNTVCWSLKMHRASGNILLGDGSAQQTTSASLNLNWARPVVRSASSNAPIRFLFP